MSARRSRALFGALRQSSNKGDKTGVHKREQRENVVDVLTEKHVKPSKRRFGFETRAKRRVHEGESRRRVFLRRLHLFANESHAVSLTRLLPGHVFPLIKDKAEGRAWQAKAFLPFYCAFYQGTVQKERYWDRWERGDRGCQPRLSFDLPESTPLGWRFWLERRRRKERSCLAFFETISKYQRKTRWREKTPSPRHTQEREVRGSFSHRQACGGMPKSV